MSSLAQEADLPVRLPPLPRRARPQFPGLQASTFVCADNSSTAQVCGPARDLADEQLVRWSAHKGADPRLDFPRSAHNAQLLQRARRLGGVLCGAPEASVGFTFSGSAFLMLLAGHLSRTWLRAGDKVLITDADHDSNRDAWLNLRSVGVRVLEVPNDGAGGIDRAAFASALQQRPRLVAFNAVSNTTGTVQPYAELAALASASGALVVLDAVQGPPHGLADTLGPDIDIAVYSNCKMFAPQLGWWAVRPDRLGALGLPANFGTHPDLEQGTPALAAIAGFVGLGEYLAQLSQAATATDPAARILASLAEIREYELLLNERLLSRASDLPWLRLIGPPTARDRVPIFCFDVPGRPWLALKAHLETYGVEGRVGSFRCVRLLERLTGEPGQALFRISLAHYNTPEEVDRIFDVLHGFGTQ